MRILTADGRGRARLALLAVLVAGLTLAGAATIGSAASTNGTVVGSVSVLNDVSTTIPGQPTPGGNIGYVLHVLNDPAQGTATVNHLLFSATIGNKGAV